MKYIILIYKLVNSKFLLFMGCKKFSYASMDAALF